MRAAMPADAAKRLQTAWLLRVWRQGPANRSVVGKVALPLLGTAHTAYCGQERSGKSMMRYNGRARASKHGVVCHQVGGDVFRVRTTDQSLRSQQQGM